MKKIFHFMDPNKPLLYLREEELEEIKYGKFLLDCSNIVLKRHSAQNQEEYSGPGYIKQDKDRNLIFKIYANQSLNTKEALEKSFQERAGTLIPAKDYFELNSRDIFHREWKCERVLPDFQSSPDATVITGGIDQLVSRAKNSIPIKNKIIKFLSFEKFEIPANTFSESNVTIAGDERKSLNFNVARFKSNDSLFQITNIKDGIELRVESEIGKFPKKIETRIHEALSFVLGRRISWSVIETVEDEFVRIRILSSHINSSPSFLPPIDTLSIDSTGKFWILFDRYLQYVLKTEASNWHPISTRIYDVIDAQNSSFATGCLILCISIEGLIDEAFPDISPLSAEYLELLDEIERIIDNWKNEREKNLEDTSKEKAALLMLTDRLTGVLGLIKSSRAKDRLAMLVKLEAINEDHMRVWIKNRPKLSHGISLAGLDKQTLVDVYFKLITLFYNLIFYRIGYVGSYSNYAKTGFLIENYPLK